MIPMTTVRVPSRGADRGRPRSGQAPTLERASTVEQNDLTMRPIAGRDELDLFSRLPYVLDEELADDLAVGRRRPEWMWVALRGDHLLARVAWGGPRVPGHPSTTVASHPTGAGAR